MTEINILSYSDLGYNAVGLSWIDFVDHSIYTAPQQILQPSDTANSCNDDSDILTEIYSVITCDTANSPTSSPTPSQSPTLTPTSSPTASPTRPRHWPSWASLRMPRDCSTKPSRFAARTGIRRRCPRICNCWAHYWSRSAEPRRQHPCCAKPSTCGFSILAPTTRPSPTA